MDNFAPKFCTMSVNYIILQGHSGLRWLILLAVLIVIVKSLIGLFARKSYTKIDNILAVSFVGLMHLQLLLGLVLYFISPYVKEAFRDFGLAMGVSELRLWALEHPILMILAVVLAQIGRSKSRRSTDDLRRFRIQVIFFTISLALILIGIPWNRV